jgi:uncharacterized protein (TIGR02271 family)
LRPGATVVSADGAWRGTVVDLTGQGADAAVRVQWDGYGLTYVTMGMLAHDNGRWVVRSEGQAQGGQQAQGAAAAQQSAQGAGAAQQGQGAQGTAVSQQSAYGQGAVGQGQGAQGAVGRDPNELARNLPQPQRAAMPQPVAGDEMTQMAAPPRPAAQPAPQPQPPMPVQGQPVRPVPEPYYPQAASAGAGREVTEVREEGRVVVPVIEEQLEAHPEWRESGSVRLNVHTEEVPQSITQDVQREEVLVERIAVGRTLAEGETLAPRREGDVEIIPVIVEEAVVTIRRVLAEEVHITKRIVTVPQTVETTVRRQQVEVEDGPLADRIHDRRNDPSQ